MSLVLQFVYILLVSNGKTAGFNICNYILIFLMMVVLAKALAVCLAKREEMHPDRNMVIAIQ